jgi:Family of unknown function (DUF6232)
MATTYYDDQAVRIDSSGIRVGDAWYPLWALTYVWHRRTGRMLHGAYMLGTRGGAVVLALLLLIALGRAVRHIHLDPRQDTMLIAGGILTVIVLGGLAAFAVEGLLHVVDRTHEHGRGRYQLWVRIDDTDQVIYSTTDATRFGQVYRALERAIENSQFF